MSDNVLDFKLDSNETNIRLETFSADRNQNVVRWLNQLEILLKYQFQLDKRKWVNVGFCHLRGKALDWLTDMLETKKNKKSNKNTFFCE